MDGITLKEFIEEKRILKTKVKLMHIKLLDEEIKKLHQEGLTLSKLSLEDLILTPEFQLICTLKDKIIPSEHNDIKLRTYFIYLSYLYNIDLLTLYEQDLTKLGLILSNLKLDREIKKNLYCLMSGSEGLYYSDCLEELNNSNYREDKLILQRSVK